MKQLIILLGLLAAPAMALDVNDASYDELVAAGFSTTDAQHIIDAQLTTTFSSSRDLLAIKGITQGDLNRVRSSLTINGEPVTTRSGTAPAIPGVRAAIPAGKSAAGDTASPGKSSSRGKSGDSQRGGNGGGAGKGN
ncbi:hypothetical protein ACFSQE_18375 [Vogesella fluminis]|uniref:Helix-hairpin-helix domain-containing protein n=1 Tax=Vogesella fluminis TaxID=1069161 RepID=A0ABQ3H6P0_9NEIS|nr:hypothetical protein [Vogesella fluminis]GHD73346.1 hypothetical protein GCM10011419_08160 [Vogesella fluminis]